VLLGADASRTASTATLADGRGPPESVSCDLRLCRGASCSRWLLVPPWRCQA